MTEITIKFKAKLDKFAGGTGYKVPALRAHHYSFSDRDTLAMLIGSSRDIAAALKLYDLELPGVIWAEARGQFCDDTSAWTVKPFGKGFMAEVSITHTLRKVK